MLRNLTGFISVRPGKDPPRHGIKNRDAPFLSVIGGPRISFGRGILARRVPFGSRGGAVGAWRVHYLGKRRQFLTYSLSGRKGDGKPLFRGEAHQGRQGAV